jgi:hypothetical protein
LSLLAQASGKQVHKRRSNNWKPGTSGNPLGGAILKIRNEAQQARYEELRQALIAEFSKPSPIELALIHQCADLLERAGRRDPRGDRPTAKLSNAGLRVLDRLRKDREARQTKPRLPSLKELGL